MGFRVWGPGVWGLGTKGLGLLGFGVRSSNLSGLILHDPSLPICILTLFPSSSSRRTSFAGLAAAFFSFLLCLLLWQPLSSGALATLQAMALPRLTPGQTAATSRFSGLILVASSSPISQTSAAVPPPPTCSCC